MPIPFARVHHKNHAPNPGPIGCCLACALGLAVALTASGCRQPAADRNTQASSPTATLTFPSELKTADQSVNAFVERAMTACASGDYGQFTAIWTGRQEAITLREFDRGWRAIRVLRVEQLRPFRTEVDGPLSYYLRAAAEFDASVPKPERTVELVVQREDGEWRLARAPEALRERLSEADLLTQEQPTPITAPPKPATP